jgi:hypothetical protein
MKPIYNPLEFIGEIELITITMIGSFITWKLLNAIYESFYEPLIDMIVDGDACDKYYVKAGKKYIKIGKIVKEFIKWLILLIILMIIYNLLIYKTPK